MQRRKSFSSSGARLRDVWLVADVLRVPWLMAGCRRPWCCLAGSGFAQMQDADRKDPSCCCALDRKPSLSLSCSACRSAGDWVLFQYTRPFDPERTLAPARILTFVEVSGAQEGLACGSMCGSTPSALPANRTLWPHFAAFAAGSRMKPPALLGLC